MRAGVWNMVTVSEPCSEVETALYQQLMRWRSLRETDHVEAEELAVLAEVLAIALTCEGYLFHEIFRGEACVLRSSDLQTLIELAVPERG